MVGVVPDFALVLDSRPALSSHHNPEPLGRLVRCCQFSMVMIREKFGFHSVSSCLARSCCQYLFTVETFLLIFNDEPRSGFRAVR
jgi:hypothetical protein